MSDSKIYVIQNKVMYQNIELLLLGSNSNCKIKEFNKNNFIAVFKFYCLNRQYYGAIKNNFKIYIRKSSLRIKKLIDFDDVFFKEIIKL